jgi:trimethylamine:corrinoid methyltransferase-like protein
MPEVLLRETYERWKSDGGKDVIETAAERATELLQAHEPPPLDPDVERELADIVRSIEVRESVA